MDKDYIQSTDATNRASYVFANTNMENNGKCIGPDGVIALDAWAYPDDEDKYETSPNPIPGVICNPGDNNGGMYMILLPAFALLILGLCSGLKGKKKQTN